MSDRSSRDYQATANEGPLAKLSMPRMATGVARPRLFELLDSARHKAAVWLVAPGGAGKSTLAATYIDERRLPYIWYQLDKNDADPATFFYYMGLAAKASARDKDVLFPLLTLEYLPDIEGFTRQYFRNLFAVLPQGSVLVLDNHHELANAPVFNGILRNAIEEVPAGATLVIISRSKPPAELTRHQVSGVLETISWEAIRLTQEETAAIAAGAGELDEATVRTLHERCEGWAAGLILFLEQIRREGVQAQTAAPGGLETIFDFFASEFFDHLPEPTQDFLLRTAPLPYMTAALAEQVSGHQEANDILQDFYRRHFFTDRRDLMEPTYQYHVLFREFLLARAVHTYSRAQWLDLVRHTGNALCEHGRHEEAIDLYLHAQQWEAAAPIILSQVPLLLTQGRAQIVAGWLRQPPEECMVSDPWLLYWHGVCQQFMDPFKARSRLEQAYAVFAAQGGVTGQLLSAAAILDMAYYLRWNPSSVTQWVDVLQNHIENNPVFLSPDMEARILSSLVSMLAYMRPGDARLPHYAKRLESLLDSGLDANERMLAAGRLIIFYALICGNPDASDRILGYAKMLQASFDVSAPTRFAWKILATLPYLFSDCDSEISREGVDTLLEMVKDGDIAQVLEENNLSALEFITAYHAVLAFLHYGDTDAAKPLLDRMETLVATQQSIDMALFSKNKCLYALAVNDFVSARHYGQISLQTHADVGAMLTQPEACCMMAIACCEGGRPEEAFDYLAWAKGQSIENRPRMRYQLCLIEAYAYLRLGDIERSHASLRDAFAVGREHHYWGNAFWLWRMLPSLCAEALQNDIETDYAHGLIRKRGLSPEGHFVEQWPWRVRIYTLGQFELEIDNKPFDVHAKAQNKPLSLLQVLIALGGTAVKRERIADVLWPDAEADSALFTFTTTLTRLRKIIGENAVYVKNGRVNLNRRVCWVDVWATERLLDEADKRDMEPSIGCGRMHKVLSLYRGAFLHDEEAQWAKRLRNQLRSRFSRFVAYSCHSLAASGATEQAVAVMRRALEVDPDCEGYFQGLLPEHILSE